ncbi:MAG: hypothetical protein ACYDDF_10355 [Thermoplasmatota archaeon]
MRDRTDDFLRFGEHLARHPVLGAATARTMASTLHVPYTTLIEWWRHMEFHRAILVSGQGTQVDRPRVLQILAAHRIAQLTPATTRRISTDAAASARALRQGGVPHALGMLSAANEWAFFEPRRSVQLFVPPAHLSQARHLLPSDPNGPIQLELFRENLSRILTQRRGDLTVTTPFQTLIDCRAHPDGGAHASFLETQVIRWQNA